MLHRPAAEATLSGSRRALPRWPAAFLAAADTNGDRALSLDEFERALDRRGDAAIAANPAAQKKIGPNERVKMRTNMMAVAFRGLDKNSDGVLDASEVKSLAH